MVMNTEKDSAVDYTLTEKKAFDAAEEYEYATTFNSYGKCQL